MEKATWVALEEQPKGEDSVVEEVLDEVQKKQKEILNLPMLPVRNTVLIPNIVVPLLVGRDQSIKAIEEAMSKDHILFVVTQLEEQVEDPGPNDVYTICVEGLIDPVLKMPNGNTRVLLR